MHHSMPEGTYVCQLPADAPSYRAAASDKARGLPVLGGDVTGAVELESHALIVTGER
jgi:hypothetical protein